MSTIRISYNARLIFALLMVALVFTNLFSFMTGFTDSDYMVGHTSFRRLRELGIPPYTIRVFGYVIAALVVLLDARSGRRLVEKPVFRWIFAAGILFTWGMLIRSFNAPVAVTNYILFAPFGSRLNSLAFLASCVLIFDHPKILHLTKQAVVFATLLGVGLNVYEVFFPGFFSEVAGRSAGLYANPNSSGMALMLGCLIGFSTLPPRWCEAFVLATVVGVLTTVSRTAIIALTVFIMGAYIAKRLSLPRLALGLGIGIALFCAFNAQRLLEDEGILNPDNRSRVTLQISDASSTDRLRLAERTFAEFAEAPLLGQGFGTTDYWDDAESHNIYLSLIADHGIIGLLIIPALVWSVGRKSWDSYTFGAAFMVWSFFDHFVFASPFSLICLAIQADESSECEDSRAESTLKERAPSLRANRMAVDVR